MARRDGNFTPAISHITGTRHIARDAGWTHACRCDTTADVQILDGSVLDFDEWCNVLRCVVCHRISHRQFVSLTIEGALIINVCSYHRLVVAKVYVCRHLGFGRRCCLY